METGKRWPERNVSCCWINKAGRDRLVTLCHGTAGFGRRGELWFVPERYGVAGLVGYGMVGSCTVCLGLAGEVGSGEFR